jgi:hypothetical protein
MIPADLDGSPEPGVGECEGSLSGETELEACCLMSARPRCVGSGDSSRGVSGIGGGELCRRSAKWGKGGAGIKRTIESNAGISNISPSLPHRSLIGIQSPVRRCNSP